jgi:hypothetical protein
MKILLPLSISIAAPSTLAKAELSTTHVVPGMNSNLSPE